MAAESSNEVRSQYCKNSRTLTEQRLISIQTKLRQRRSLLINAELLSVPDEEDEEEIQRIDIESAVMETSSPLRPWSDFSLTSIPAAKELSPTTSTSFSQSRSYRFVQLEGAFTAAKLLETYPDRMRFHQDYLQSIRENTFDEFLRQSHQKLTDYHAKIKQERLEKQARAFTFVDLEERFLSRDPTREIKIVFLDDPTGITYVCSSRTHSSC